MTAPRPTELRYRLADFINDRLKKIPGLHLAVKTATSRYLWKKEAGAAAAKSRPAKQSPVVDQRPGAAPQPARSADEQQPVSSDSLPFPPFEMRELVGTTDLSHFDNPEGKLVFRYIDFDLFNYDKIFDFGCGCGRLARMLIQQKPRPKRYVGIDLHAGMVRWCQENLQPAAPGFTFLHHDVFNIGFNPKRGSPLVAPFPVGDAQFTLVLAHSVFTHLTEQQALHYLRECARILEPGGVLYASWFFFDKRDFPIMQESANALYVSYEDPSAAVIFDREWMRTTAREAGLRIVGFVPPSVKGHQWAIMLTKRDDVQEPELPPDTAPRGVLRPPVGPPDPAKVGLGKE